jgi:hypothetical protein
MFRHFTLARKDVCHAVTGVTPTAAPRLAFNGLATERRLASTRARHLAFFRR